MKILIAGGIGITSIIQIIEKVTNDPSDNTKITLIYGNNNSGKILLRQELDIIAEKNANKFRVIYTVDKFEEKWAYEVGYVNDEMIKKYLPPPSKNNFMYICGPPEQVKNIAGPKDDDYSQGNLKGSLERLGYNKENVFKF